ncbi:isopenicillin N synthase family oxygenase [Rhodococcus sp. BL-253-APC-6A1W]|uniref:isopenicillin N synthase family dioxygenase n=1 Tax=Rhodococcus sp. BL-253-APC-6A1W TaxID=2725307 RepID=UPI00146B3B39|nr:isopenicillin N synthase family oxygenase [Rhodococcus sp. BL-253-APC-6A1W]NMD96316.1 isopenicillin N synthase family oxygenase [Rhodococcus sp. BL-253-APC-6A1W]
MDALPVIDLRPLRDGSDPHTVVRALDAACTDLGFFVVTGHGLEPGLRAETMEQAHRFFSLPFEEKMEISIAKSPCHSGYVPPKAETLDEAIGADAKEALDITYDRGPDHPEVVAGTPLHGPAQWPAALMPEFKSVADEYAHACLEINTHLMRGLALALGLTCEAFEPMFTDPIASLRMLHYAPAGPGEVAPGAGAHTDYGSLTLLAQDDVGGLQVAARGGGWIDVATPPDALIVNLGDMIARWTNHRYVSTLHRVLNPVGKDRYSLPYFVAPDFHAVIEAIPTCVEQGAEPIYPPITVGEYMLSRFDATHDYLKKEAS